MKRPHGNIILQWKLKVNIGREYGLDSTGSG
jgi:hypothetical protein